MGIRALKTLIGKGDVLGHPIIDADHFAIAACWQSATVATPIALPLHIARLRRLIRSHFDREAALVEASGATFCHCHRREHAAILALCNEAYALAEKNWKGARALLRAPLRRLVRDHVASMDQLAVLMINSAAAGGGSSR